MRASRRRRGKTAATGVASVERALSILNAFSQERPILTLTEIADDTAFYKSTVLRLLASLTRYGYVVRLKDGTYALGPEALRLGLVYQKSFLQNSLVETQLTFLAETLNETSGYFVADKAEYICLFKSKPNRTVAGEIRVGSRRPIDHGAPGRIFSVFGTSDFPGVATSREDKVILRKMCITMLHEDASDTAMVAAPVFRLNRGCVAAICILGPSQRFLPPFVETIERHLRKSAALITYALGGPIEKFSSADLPDIRRYY